MPIENQTIYDLESEKIFIRLRGAPDGRGYITVGDNQNPSGYDGTTSVPVPMDVLDAVIKASDETHQVGGKGEISLRGTGEHLLVSCLPESFTKNLDLIFSLDEFKFLLNEIQNSQ